MKLIHGVLIHGVLILLVLLLVMFTMSLSKSQDSSAQTQTKSDTDSKAVPALKLDPELKKVSDAQKDTISILLDRIKEVPASVEKSNKKTQTASTLLNSSNRSLSKVIDMLIPRTARFNKLYLIEVEPFTPIQTLTPIPVDSMAVPSVTTPEPERINFFKRIFHK